MIGGPELGSQIPIRAICYGYRTDNKKQLVTSRVLNLSSFLDFPPGVFVKSASGTSEKMSFWFLNFEVSYHRSGTRRKSGA